MIGLDSVDGPNAALLLEHLTSAARSRPMPIVVAASRRPLRALPGWAEVATLVTLPTAPWPDAAVAHLAEARGVGDQARQELVVRLSAGIPLIADCLCRSLPAQRSAAVPAAMADEAVREILARLRREGPRHPATRNCSSSWPAQRRRLLAAARDETTPTELARHCLFLTGDPLIRDHLFPTTADTALVRPMTAGDEEAIARLVHSWARRNTQASNSSPCAGMTAARQSLSTAGRRPGVGPRSRVALQDTYGNDSGPRNRRYCRAVTDDRVRPPGGTADVSGEPEPRLVEENLEPRPWTATWLDPPFRPNPPDATQVYAICFVPDGRIVLIRLTLEDGSAYWNLPGGGIKPGETLEDCLHREVLEEACAEVTSSAYLGCQRVDDPHHPTGPERHYQTRFCARVELLPWRPEHETIERQLVTPGEFLSVLSWGSAATARVILEEGLRLNARLS